MIIIGILTTSLSHAEEHQRTIDSRFVSYQINKSNQDTVFYLNSNFLPDGLWTFYYDKDFTRPAIEVEIAQRSIASYYKEYYTNGQLRFECKFENAELVSYQYKTKVGTIVERFVKSEEYDLNVLDVVNEEKNKTITVHASDNCPIELKEELNAAVFSKTKWSIIGMSKQGILLNQLFPYRVRIVDPKSVGTIKVLKDKPKKSEIWEIVSGPALLVAVPIIFKPGTQWYKIAGSVGVASTGWSVYKFIDRQKMYRKIKLNDRWKIELDTEPLSANIAQ